MKSVRQCETQASVFIYLLKVISVLYNVLPHTHALTRIHTRAHTRVHTHRGPEGDRETRIASKCNFFLQSLK